MSLRAPPRGRTGAGPTLAAWRRRSTLPVLWALATLAAAVPGDGGRFGASHGAAPQAEAGGSALRAPGSPLEHGLRSGGTSSLAGLAKDERSDPTGPVGPRSHRRRELPPPAPAVRAATGRASSSDPRRRLSAGFVPDRSTAPPHAR